MGEAECVLRRANNRCQRMVRIGEVHFAADVQDYNWTTTRAVESTTGGMVRLILANSTSSVGELGGLDIASATSEDGSRQLEPSLCSAVAGFQPWQKSQPPWPLAVTS